MIRRIVVTGFKKFCHLESELEERAVIAGPNNSGKSTLLQAMALWAELGEIWLRSLRDFGRQDYRNLHRVEVGVDSLSTVAVSSFDELWHNQETRTPIIIEATTDEWSVGFDLSYQDATLATLGPLSNTSVGDIEAFAKNPPKALYVPSLSGLDMQEPEYSDRVVATRLAHGKGGMVLRNMVQAASLDREKWVTLQTTIRSFFGFQLSPPSGVDPIVARYRHSTKDHWYDFLSGAAGFLQTVLVQSALLHSNASLFLIDEPDAHLHALLKAKMYRLIREHCEEHGCQVLIATHSSRLIDEAEREGGGKLFLVTARGLRAVRRQDAKELSMISGEEIVLAETMECVLYLEGKTDVDVMREWAKVLDHPVRPYLETGFWVPTAEGKRGFVKRHYSALKAQVPNLRAVEVRDRNEADGKHWVGLEQGHLRVEEGHRKTPEGMKILYWSRYETENYLICPEPLLRFLSHALGDEGAGKARAYMAKYLPGVLFDRPFETTDIDRVKGKGTISRILAAAGMDLGESDYYRIAAVMKPNEIHPDVVAMLDAMEAQLAGDEVGESDGASMKIGESKEESD